MVLHNCLDYLQEVKVSSYCVLYGGGGMLGVWHNDAALLLLQGLDNSPSLKSAMLSSLET